MKQGFIVLGFLVAFAMGVYLTWQMAKPADTEYVEQSTVVLEQVKKVLKLVTIEGQLSETYKGGDIKNLTFYLPFPTRVPAAKQAVIHVTGKVLVGYDMKQVQINMDQASQVLTISNLPEPEILSIDHELNYFNIEESWFNSFAPNDYNRLNKDAKEKLREAALKSNLLQQAEEQGNQLIEVIRILVETAGWTLQYDNGLIKMPIDSLLN